MKKQLSIGCMIILIFLLIIGCLNRDTSQYESKGKVVHIVTHANWKPFEYLEQGKIVGFDLDLIKEILDKTGYAYDIKDAGWESMFEQVKNGTVDAAISGITLTDSRKETYDFSQPYFASRQAMVVQGNSKIYCAADLLLDDRAVAVQNGSTGQVCIEKIMGKNNPNIKKTALSLQMILNNQVDALICDDTQAKQLIQQYPNQDLKIIYDDNAFPIEYFCIMYPKNSVFKENFDKALNEIIENGTYAEIYRKSFHQNPDISQLKNAIVQQPNLNNKKKIFDFKFSIIKEYSYYFFQGTILTIKLSLTSIIIGTILGLLLALGRLSHIRGISYSSIFYIEIFRGTPLLLQLLIIYFGVIPLFLNKSDGIAASVLALSLNVSAYIAETFRAGILSVPKGQMEAARSLGMSYYQSMQYVILPQAMKKILPPLGNSFISLIKDSSLASTIATPELMYWANAANAQYFRVWESFVTTGLIYLFLTLFINYILKKIERKL